MQDALPGEGGAASLKPLPWKNVSDVLTSAEAAALLAETRAELLSQDFATRVNAAQALAGEVCCNGEALIVLGPSAAGKSHALGAGVLTCPGGAQIIDGTSLRQASRVWAEVVSRARREGLSGFSDYYKKYFMKPMNQVKDALVDEAVQCRANVVIPHTASDFAAVAALVAKLSGAGYRIRCAAIYADRALCESRGGSREVEEGKKYDSKNWRTSVGSILAMQELLHLRAPSGLEPEIEVYHNTGTFARISFPQLESLLAVSRAVPCRGGWCESRLLAGVYRSPSGRRYEVLPFSYDDEVVDVRVTPLSELAEGGGGHEEVMPRNWTFHVETCTLRPVVGDEVLALSLTRAPPLPTEGG